MESEGVLELPCESVPRYLGCLYNGATGLFLNESITLWKNKDIQVAKESGTVLQPSSNVEVIREENFSDNMKNFGMSVSLTLGLLAGLLSIKGGVGFVVDRKKSRKVARLTLKYQCTTRFEQLSTNKLSAATKNERNFASGEHEATHVVVGVLYGANAYFVFEKEITHKDDYDQVKGELELSIGLFIASISAGVAVNVEHRSTVDTTSISCTYHTEGFSSKASTASLSYDEALEMFRKLPNFFDEESVVSQKVWLIPLSYVPETVGRALLKKVSSHYVDEALKIVDHLTQAMNQVDDLAKNVVCSKIEFYETKFIDVTELFKQYRTKLAFRFLTVLANVRRGVANESDLVEIIENYYSSPFCNSRLQTWFDAKEKEIILLGKCIEFLENAGVECCHDIEFNLTNVFYLYFYFYEEIEFFNELRVHIQHKGENAEQTCSECEPQPSNNETSSSELECSMKEWADNPHLLTDMRQKVIEFVKFVKCNKGGKSAKFFYRQLVNVPCHGPEDVFVEIALEGTTATVCPFVLPGPPGKPEASVVFHNAITVKWCKSERGCAQICGYRLSYCLECDPDKSWESCEIESDGSDMEKKVEGLLSNMSYIFRVQAVCQLLDSASGTTQCVGEYSEISTSIKTKRSTVADNYKTLLDKSDQTLSTSENGESIETQPTREINGERRGNVETPRSTSARDIKRNSSDEIPSTSKNDSENKSGSKIGKVFEIPAVVLSEDCNAKVLRYRIGVPSHEEREVKTILLIHPPSEIEVLPVAEVIENLIMGVSFEDSYRLSLPSAKDKKDWLISYFFHWQEGMIIPYSLNIVIAPDLQLPLGGISSKQFSGQPPIDSVNLIAFVTRPDVFADLTLQNMSLIQSLFSITAIELRDCIVTLQNPFEEPVVSIPKLGVTFNEQFDVVGDGLYETGEGSNSFWTIIAKGCNSLLKRLSQADTISLQKTVSILKRQEILLQKLGEIMAEKNEVKILNDRIQQLEASNSTENAGELEDAINEYDMKQRGIISDCSEVSQELDEISLLTICPTILSCLDNLNKLNEEKENEPTICSIRDKALLIEHSLF